MAMTQLVNKREMEWLKKCAFFLKDIFKYHGYDDGHDDDDGTWHMARGKEEGGLADGGV